MKENKKDRPFVFVRCITYNHEPYIEDALKGFVMQKTDFPFLAVVIDDCSTDGTADIVRRYEAMYPDKIKGVYLPHNFWRTKEDKRPYFQQYIDKATYWAECEGDDYWTDPLKLQKQVDFMEGHPDYSMCFHAAEILNETDTKEKITCETIQTKEYFTNDLFPGWVVPTASVIFRISLFNSYKELRHREWMKFSDIVWFLTCSHTGRVWGMEEKMSVYRITEKGQVLSSQKDAKYFETMCRHYDFLMLNFPRLDHAWPNEYIASYYYTKLRRTNDIKTKFECLKQIVTHKPNYLLRKIKESIKTRIGRS